MEMLSACRGMPPCEALYLALIASFALPTGTVFGFPLKMALLGLSALAMLPFLFDRRVAGDRALLGFAGVLALLAGWTLWGWRNGFGETAADCLKQFVSLIAVVAVGWAGYRTGALSRRRMVGALRWTALAGVIFKFAVEIVILGRFAMLPGLNPTDSMIEILARIFGAQLSTCAIPLGCCTLYRVMLASDALVLAVLPFELLRPQSAWRRALVVAVASVFVLLTYSRVVMLLFALMLLVCAAASMPRRRFLKALAVLALAVAALSPVGWRVAGPMLHDRLMSADARKSDSARTEQFAALARGIVGAPLLGHGTGSYVADCTRGAGRERYSYELQYLSFVYQFGIVGFVLIVAALVALCFRLCLACAAGGAVRAVVWFNLVVWAVKPLFNPQLLSSNSAAVVIATLFLGMAEARTDGKDGNG